MVERFPDGCFIDLVEDVVGKIQGEVEVRTLEAVGSTVRSLVKECPDASVELAGQSAEGRPIELIKLGNGPVSVLFLGAPHPAEIVGTLAIEALVHALRTDGPLREAFDLCTFLFIPVCDPDGYWLNEPWFRLESNPVNHLLYQYRPSFPEQAIWSYPARYKRFVSNDPSPECRALMHVIDTYHPAYVDEIHNGEIISCFASSSQSEPALTAYLAKLASNLGVGFRDVYEPHTAAMAYDRKAAEGDACPGAGMGRGTGTYEYMNRVRPGSDWFCFEVPLWKLEDVVNRRPEPTDWKLQDVKEHSITMRERSYCSMAEHLPGLRAHREAQNHAPVQRLLRAVGERFGRMSREAFEDERNKLRECEDRHATVHEVFLSIGLWVFYQDRNLGMLWRAADFLRIESVKSDLRGLIEADMSYLMNECEPIRLVELVRAEVAAALISMKMSLNRLMNFVTD